MEPINLKNLETNLEVVNNKKSFYIESSEEYDQYSDYEYYKKYFEHNEAS